MTTSSPRVLVLHSSRFGQSIKIAEAIGQQMRTQGVAADVRPLTPVSAPDPSRYVGLVLVMSVRYGHFSADVDTLIQRYAWWLNSVPTLMVTVSLTARTAEKRSPETHLYTRKYLAKIPWKPTHVEVVAGALEYPRYNTLDRLAIQMIMTMTHGPTDPTTMIEYTDWDHVRDIADDFAATVTSH
ncbi:MAG: menaquinone-dependent protoporphyrinogen IX dehydrogenase [Propionibacteriaceae bacterium]|nr:menaquinone-dependent protoporphyrinogen IX dehydrogenase [Propionibacteriaceae bacterium]